MKKYIKRYKLLSLFIFLTIFIIILSILFSMFISKESQEVISNNINLLINNKLINYNNLIINNITTTIIIWLLGISILGIILILPIYLFKVFIVSFEIISLLKYLGLKNILLVLVYLIPNVINTFTIFIICYYSITYSLYLIRHIFKNVKYNMYLITKKYILVLIISLLIIILSSILEIFILPKLNIIKY